MVPILPLQSLSNYPCPWLLLLPGVSLFWGPPGLYPWSHSVFCLHWLPSLSSSQLSCSLCWWYDNLYSQCRHLQSSIITPNLSQPGKSVASKEWLEIEHLKNKEYAHPLKLKGYWQHLGAKCRWQSGWTGLLLQVLGSHHQWHTHGPTTSTRFVPKCLATSIFFAVSLGFFLSLFFFSSLNLTFSLSLTTVTLSAQDAPSLKLSDWRPSSTMPVALSFVNVVGPPHQLLVVN